MVVCADDCSMNYLWKSFHVAGSISLVKSRRSVEPICLNFYKVFKLRASLELSCASSCCNFIPRMERPCFRSFDGDCIIATYLSQQPDNCSVLIIPDISGMRKVGQGI